MIKTIKSIKEISTDSLEPGLILIDNCNSDSHSTSGANIALVFANDHKIPTVYFSLEKKEDDILRNILTTLLTRYTDNLAGLATAPQEEWEKARDGIITLSKAPLLIDDSPDLSIDLMHALAKVIISEQKVRLFIIDGIHLLVEKNPIQLLASIAAALEVTIIAL